ncbi:MAG TPA: hypothetical protein VHP58_00735 [Alphaproteobacteria bacterium]|nr:hypothetical protein [Alphaproteobacteria bacterium]
MANNVTFDHYAHDEDERPYRAKRRRKSDFRHGGGASVRKAQNLIAREALPERGSPQSSYNLQRQR